MDLLEIRKKIDKLDFELVRILSDRTNLIKNVAEYKQKNSIPIIQEGRMEDIFKKRMELAKKLSLDSDFIEHLFLDIINESIKIQKKKIGEN